MRKYGAISRVLMALSPHDEAKLDENTARLRDKIQKREETRERAKQESLDYIDLQLRVMRRE